MIQTCDLALRAGTRELLAPASFEIRSGEFVAIMGANGAGKTTLLQTLAGIRAPASGKALIDDRDVALIPQRERARLIAHIAADDAFLDRLTTREVVSM